MVPLPLIVQLCVTVPPTGSTVEVCVLVVPAQNGPAGVIEHVGFGVTVKVAEHVLVQPKKSITRAVYVPALTAWALTIVIMDTPFDATPVFVCVNPFGPLQMTVSGGAPRTVFVKLAVAPAHTVKVEGTIEQDGRAAMVMLCWGEALTLRVQFPDVSG